MTFHPLIQKVVSSLQAPPGGRVVEIGSQTIIQPNGQQASAETFYRQLGWADYACLDLDGKWGALPVDLNELPSFSYGTETSCLFGKYPVPESSFDLVTNNGTGEHIFNQAAVFAWAHALCKPEGLMLHVLPWAGWLNHGFYGFQPALFRDLATANGYGVLGLYAAERNGRMERLDGVAGLDPFHAPKPFREPLTAIERIVRSFGDRGDVFIVAILRMPKDKAAFRAPMQAKYADVGKAVLPAPMPHMLHRRVPVVVQEPWPHVVIHDVLDAELYAELSRTFPKWEAIAGDKANADTAVGNVLGQMPAHKVLGNPAIGEAWRRFFLAHVGEDWVRSLLDLFSAELAPYMAALPKSANVGVFGTGDFDLKMQVQFAVNTPTLATSRVRGPHVDSPDELVAGLFYVPVPGDSQGGDLVLYRRGTAAPVRTYGKAELPDDDVVEMGRVAYAPNTLLLFPNGPHVVHGVSERAAGPLARRYINLALLANKPVMQMVEQDWDISQDSLRAAHRREPQRQVPRT